MTKQFTKEEIQLMDKMGSLASMLDIVFEPSNSFQVESKTVKVNNKYLLSLNAHKDIVRLTLEEDLRLRIEQELWLLK